MCNLWNLKMSCHWQTISLAGSVFGFIIKADMLWSFAVWFFSSVDKAHLRLAAAKAVLRLSKHWEHKIPVDVFYLALRTPEVKSSLDILLQKCCISLYSTIYKIFEHKNFELQVILNKSFLFHWLMLVGQFPSSKKAIIEQSSPVHKGPAFGSEVCLCLLSWHETWASQYWRGGSLLPYHLVVFRLIMVEGFSKFIGWVMLWPFYCLTIGRLKTT